MVGMSNEEFTVTLPKLGESIMSATVVQWFKKKGDTVTLDEPLLEVSTDKVNSEIPSPVKGIVKEILADPDIELDVGAPLAVISTSDAPATAATKTTPTEQPKTCDQSMSSYYSPSVLRLAQEKGLTVDQLAKIPGTGSGGRITKKDLENYKSSAAPTVQAGDAEQIQLSGMRKMIADKMVQSSTEIPHATLVSEIDVTDAMALISKEKEAFLKTHGVKPTITSLIAKAIATAAAQYPAFNATFDGSTLTKHSSVNVGIAVSLEQGLMVPVIKDCNTKTIPEIAKSVADFASRARSNTLNPDDVQNGTITMTNFGMGGTLIGIPIIRDHFYAQVKQCSQMGPWAHEYERSQPSRASTEAGHQYSYQHLAEGVRYLIEKRNDERNKRLMQRLPNQERRHDQGKYDRRAAPGSERDPRKDERTKLKKPVKACAAYTKGKCKKGQYCPEHHDDKAKKIANAILPWRRRSVGRSEIRPTRTRLAGASRPPVRGSRANKNVGLMPRANAPGRTADSSTSP